MRIWSIVLAAACVGAAVCGAEGQAQDRRVALKAGETVELMTVYYVSNCRSIMVGIPEIEVLEGPRQVTLAIKEEMVLPRRQGCANPVPGGRLVATANDIKERVDTKITYRVKYVTRDGERPRAHTYLLSLFP